MLAWARKHDVRFQYADADDAYQLAYAALGYDIQNEIGRDEYCRRHKITRKEYDDERAGID